MVEALVLKLLAKTAEERYQTAGGVAADLQTCLAAWESLGRIEPFPLGTRDASDRFMVPEKLYGRECEIDRLLTAFDRVVTRGTPELVLVSGYSGIGKSSVVNELHKVLVPPRILGSSGRWVSWAGRGRSWVPAWEGDGAEEIRTEVAGLRGGSRRTAGKLA
jgi:hypothetical protein